MRSAARRAGFRELEGPCVEPLDLYREKSGDEIADQVWSFRDKGDREVALTPESTPTLARIFAARAVSESLPVKWFTVAKLWRYEEPQAGRTREFQQFNLDILGVEGLEAETDLLATAALVLDAAGAQGLYAFRVNDRALAEGVGRALGAQDAPRFFRAVDQFRKLDPDRFLEELLGAGISRPGADDLIELYSTVRDGVPATEAPAFFEQLARWPLDPTAREGIERLRRLAHLSIAAGISDRWYFDPTVVRGLAYYTSTVFEAFARDAGGRALFGGGRYDRLVEMFGGPATPAVGLAVGDQTLEQLLRSADRWPEGEPLLDLYVVTVSPELREEAIRLTAELRAHGRSADLDLMGRSMSRQLREAARRARRAILLGPKELARGVVLERDLTSGSQVERPRSSVAQWA
jgi:histidyl-tRNA synthetase